MGATTERNYLGARIRTSWGFEWCSVFVMTNWAKVGAGNPRQIVRTNPNHLWNAGTGAPDLAGQTVTILNGTSAGMKLHIIAATDDANNDYIEFEEDINTAGSLYFWTFLATDRFSVSMIGLNQSEIDAWDTMEGAAQLFVHNDTSEFWGPTDETDLPELVQEVYSIYAASDDLPARYSSVVQSAEYTSSIPVNLINPKIMVATMGYVSEDGTTVGAGSTLAVGNPTYEGEIFITCAGVIAGLVATDYVLIGDNAGGALNEGAECRQVIDIGAAPIYQLDRPLRRYHPAGAVVIEVDDTLPITHTLRSRTPYIPFCLETRFRGYDRFTATNDTIIHYTGLHATGFNFSSNTSAPLVMNVDVSGLDLFVNDKVASVVDESDYTGKDVFHHKQGNLTVNSVLYRQVDELNSTLSKEGQVKRYFNRDTGIKPFEVIPGRLTTEYDFIVPYHNNLLTALAEDGTVFDTVALLTRGANDTLQFTWADAQSPEAKRSQPATGDIPINVQASAKHLVAVVVDDIEYY